MLTTIFAVLLAANQPTLVPFGKLERGQATVFGGKHDHLRGGKSRCLRPMRRISSEDWGIAHRTYRCGTLVRVCLVKTQRCVIAPVIDHGPYGAILRRREVPAPGQTCKTRKNGDVWCIKNRPGHAGKRIGLIDVTCRVAFEIGLSRVCGRGKGTVEIRRMSEWQIDE